MASSSSPVADTHVLARFEFEAGRGNEGTKILMVEWSDLPGAGGPDDTTTTPTTAAAAAADWQVSWEGKITTSSQDESEDGGINRLYFLIPSDVPVPSELTISHPPTNRSFTTKCMPAIFAPGLGTRAGDAGKRGVLHTRWAKKRLGQLHEEIEAELHENSESVGLEMAVQERLWIIEHFGIIDTHAQALSIAPHLANSTEVPLTPRTPRSPIGGRLGEKLKGLKLNTSTSELSGVLGMLRPCVQFSLYPPCRVSCYEMLLVLVL